VNQDALVAYYCTMSRGDNGDRVRPIEYAPDDVHTTESSLVADQEPGRPRPWIALALSATAVIVAVGAVSIFGSLESNDPTPPEPQEFASGAQSDPEAPPETLPPRLEDSLPNLTDRLTLVALVDDTLQTLLWDPSFRVPRAYDLPIDSEGPLVDIEASFDSGGRMLALTVTTPQNTRIYLGNPTDIGRAPDIVGATSLRWHASEVGAIAWAVPGPNGKWDLHTGKVDPLSGTILNDTVVTSFGIPVGLVRWDSDGFVLNQGSAVIAVDPSGTPMWQQAGVAVSGSASILSIIAPDDSASETRWLIADRLTGAAGSLQVNGPPSEVWVTTSRDTDLIAEITASSNATRVLVNGPELASRRIVQVDLDVRPVGFTASGEYLQFDQLDSNDLVFVNWRTGATHTVPIPDDTIIIGSDLG
jgi:hypothetical protein